MNCPECGEAFTSIRAAVLHEEATGHAPEFPDEGDSFGDEVDVEYARLKESW